MRRACPKTVASLAGTAHLWRDLAPTPHKLSGQAGPCSYRTHSSEARMWLTGSPYHHIKGHKGRELAWGLEEGSGTKALRAQLESIRPDGRTIGQSLLPNALVRKIYTLGQSMANFTGRRPQEASLSAHSLSAHSSEICPMTLGEGGGQDPGQASDFCQGPSWHTWTRPLGPTQHGWSTST